jgi:hypothetical protein
MPAPLGGSPLSFFAAQLSLNPALDRRRVPGKRGRHHLGAEKIVNYPVLVNTPAVAGQR